VQISRSVFQVSRCFSVSTCLILVTLALFASGCGTTVWTHENYERNNWGYDRNYGQRTSIYVQGNLRSGSWGGYNRRDDYGRGYYDYKRGYYHSSFSGSRRDRHKNR